MAVEDAAEVVADGCLNILGDALFPRRALRRRMQRSPSTLPTTPVGCGARLIALLIWGTILTAIVVTVYLVLFGLGPPPARPN
ncbi:MAG: hypothetical protein ACYTGX_14680 [Planctomycetota bacterium]|jgi:hypothetical protein